MTGREFATRGSVSKMHSRGTWWMPTAHEYREKAAELLAKAREVNSNLLNECLRLAYGYMRLADHAEANTKRPVQQQQQPQPLASKPPEEQRTKQADAG